MPRKPKIKKLSAKPMKSYTFQQYKKRQEMRERMAKVRAKKKD